MEYKKHDRGGSLIRITKKLKTRLILGDLIGERQLMFEDAPLQHNDAGR